MKSVAGRWLASVSPNSSRMRTVVLKWLLGALLLQFGSPSIYAAETAWPKIEIPPSMQLQVVSDGMSINGMQIHILEFRSPQNATELTEWFSKEWEGRIARSRAGQWEILAHRERDALITVQMSPVGSQGSRGFIATSNAFAPPARNRSRTAPAVPMLPGTQLVQDLQAVDAGRKSRTLVLLSDKSSAQNLDFYRARYQEEGYEPVSYGALVRNESGGAMILNRGAEQLNVAVAERMGRTMVTIVSIR